MEREAQAPNVRETGKGKGKGKGKCKRQKDITTLCRSKKGWMEEDRAGNASQTTVLLATTAFC